MEQSRIDLAQTLTISEGESRKATSFAARRMTWARFVARLRTPVRTAETCAQYASMSRAERAEIKDVGGFVGGRLEGGSRKSGSVTERQLLCLDIDYGDETIWESWACLIGCAAVMHSTHSHTKEAPRLRLLIPLSRPVTAEEYAPIGRRIADMLDMEAFDDTTFEANRLMYWPSCCADGDYIFREMDGDWVNPDDVLASYADWHDMRQWPVSSRQSKAIRKMGERQGDPLQKPGIIGAFNRAYRITDAIEKYLPGVYTPAGSGRWTYAAGSTVGGMVTYDDDTFSYSHHDTDPTSGRLCSAYDLVRIHLYGKLDEGCEDDPATLPSTKKMKELVAGDEAVRAELADGIRKAPDEAFQKLDDLERFVDDTTEQGLAASFVDQYGRDLRYCRAFGWMFWDGQRWALDAEAEASMLAMRYADDLYGQARTLSMSADGKADKERAKALMKAATKLRTASGNKNLLKLAQAIVYDGAPETYDADGWSLNTPEGIIDLHTGAIRPHDPQARCTKITSVSPGDESAERWQGFLDHITGGDAEFARYLQTLSGMAAVGEVCEEGLCISHGPGGNGKSTFFGALRSVLGDYARGINADVLVSSGGRPDLSYVAALRGVRLAVMGETDEGAHFSLALMKRLTSRDTISARALYKDPIEFSPTHTIIMHTNHLPRLSSLDEGTKRRIAVAPFPATLPPEKIITNFEQVLVRESGPAIMKWIVDGARMFFEAGCKLKKPACVLRETAKYTAGEDWMAQFMSECCELGEGLEAPGSALYQAYSLWAKANGEYVRRNRDFALALEIKGCVRARRKTGSVWTGIGIREEDSL